MWRNKSSLIFCLFLLVAVSFGSTQGLTNPPWWTGQNAALKDYYVQPGYPPYEQHARYIGDLKGTWKEMGVQYGERAGDLVRLVFEGYYDQIFATMKDSAKIVRDSRLFAEYLKKLVPEAYDFIAGISEGASAELAKSTKYYASIGNDFDKVMIINLYFACRRVTGTQYTWAGGIGKLETDSSLAAIEIDEDTYPACTGVVVVGKLDGPSKDKTTIHGGTRDQVFFPQLYEVTYTTTPSDPSAYRIWTIASAGEIGGQLVGNDQGVMVSGFAGGNSKNLWAYGIEWNVGCWYGATFAKTAEEAANILTVGRPGFIKNTGAKVVIPAWGINWLISDMKDARVVEIVPGRYAVRKIGDFGEENFIVCTNHCVATWSYDENNTRTKRSRWLTMAQKPAITPACRSAEPDIGPSSGTSNTTMGISIGTWSWIGTAATTISTETANVTITSGIKPLAGFPLISRRPPFVATRAFSPDAMKGTTVDAKVGVAQDLAFYFTKGRGHDWVGPWDLLSLKNVP